MTDSRNPSPNQDDSESAELGVGATARAIRAGMLGATTLVQRLIERIEANRHLNAFIAFDADEGLRAARAVDATRSAGQPLGPLAGVPLVIKDNIHVEGFRNSAGTPALREFRPAADAPVIATLRRAGAIVLGKTNMHELAFGITSNNSTFGAVATPYDTRRFAGGSSGGTAAAIAARLAPGGLGTDTGGSIRIPAALTGIAGFRPTLGRYPQAGITPIAHSRDTAGPMARSVADLVLLDEVITQTQEKVASPPPAQLRLGIEREHFWADLDTDVQAVLDQVLRRLSAAGVELVEVTMPGFANLSGKAGFSVSLYEARHELPAYLAQWNTGLSLEALTAHIASPDVKDIFDRLVLGPEAVSAASYRAAREEFQPALQWLYDDSFRRHHLDALIFPTTPLPAQVIGASDKTVILNGRSRSTFEAFVRNTYPGANAGVPGLSLPAGLTTAGLPIGIELDGPAGSDRRLLAIGLALEALLPRLPAPPSHK